MATTVTDPTLPYSTGTMLASDMVTFDGDLARVLVPYLQTVAMAINERLPLDGSLPMTGNLDLGGFNIVNAGDVDANNLVAGRVKVTLITATGGVTFTTDADTLFADVWAFGGGGAGGGAPGTAAGQNSMGSGGQAGGMAFRRLTAAQLGASQTVTIAAAAAGAAGAAGGAGSATTFGALVSAAGGAGGVTGGPTTGVDDTTLPAVTQSATGDLRGWTTNGTRGMSLATGTRSTGGNGGTNMLGGAGIGFRTAGAGGGAGGAAQANTGAGGGGAADAGAAAATAGGAGGTGVVLVVEYLKPA